MQHNYKHHPQFVSELANFIDHHCDPSASYKKTIEDYERLLNVHFFSPSEMFTKKHLGLAQGFGAHQVYWLHFSIADSGLSRTQEPKIYFYKNSILSFLCLNSHITNYKDSKLRKIAVKRLDDVLNNLCE